MASLMTDFCPIILHCPHFFGHLPPDWRISPVFLPRSVTELPSCVINLQRSVTQLTSSMTNPQRSVMDIQRLVIKLQRNVTQLPRSVAELQRLVMELPSGIIELQRFITERQGDYELRMMNCEGRKITRKAQ